MRQEFYHGNVKNSIDVQDLGDEIKVVHAMGNPTTVFFSYNSHTYSIEAAEWLEDALRIALMECARTKEKKEQEDQEFETRR